MRHITNILLIIGAQTAQHSGFASQPLTDAEADAIIAAEETARAEKEAARIAQLNDATILSEGSYLTQEGDTVTVRQIEPPVWSTTKNPNQPAITEKAEPTPEQIAAFQAAQAQIKEQRSFQLSATYYETASHLRWRHDDEAYEAWTPVNWKHLRGVHSIESDEASYFLLMGVGAGPEDTELPDLSTVPAYGYLLTQGDPNNEAAFDALEAALDHYETYADELHVQTQRREALAAARERYKTANPEQPKQIIINYFDPKPEVKK